MFKLSASCSKGQCVEDIKVWDLVPPDRGSLTKLKHVSIRNKSWFTVLSWKQRRFIDAVITTVDKIRSLLMLTVLAPLVKNLLTAIGGDINNGAFVLMGHAAYKMTKNIANKIVSIAHMWGNKSAHRWLNNEFIKYLMIMNLPQNKNSLAF